MQKLLDKYYLELVKIPSHNEVSSGDEDSDYGPEEEKIMYLDVSIVVEDDWNYGHEIYNFSNIKVIVYPFIPVT